MKLSKKTNLDDPSVLPVCPNEVERLSVLRRYGILDTPPERFFDHVTRLAARLLKAPISLVTLVDQDRLWFKSRHGLEIQQTRRDVAFCAYAILSDDVLVVPDASRDPRFAQNPLVTGPLGIRFYAGAPLKTADGFNLGTVCIIDKKPRRGLTAFQRQLLESLSEMVMQEFRARLENADHGRSHYEVFPDLPERWRAVHPRCLAGAVERNEADLWVRSDGSTDWIRWEVRPWRRSDDTIGGLIILSEAITEQKRAELERDELLQREQEARTEAELARTQLSNVLERIGDGFVGLDLDWRYTYINEKGAQLFGRRPEDLLGKHIWTQFPEGIDQPFAKAYRRALATQQMVYLEDYYQPWDRWFENRIYPSAEGLSIFYTEITERKRAEEAIGKSQKLLRELIDGLGPAMFVGLLTPDGIILEANRPALEAAGLRLEDVIGKPVEETYWFSYSELVRRQLRETMERAASGQSSRFDVTIRVADGQLIPLDFSVQPVLDEAGKVVHIVPSAMVITERVQAFEALKQSEQRLKELAGYLQSAREEERTKIAREIHDELGQALTALKFDLSRLGRKLPENGDALRQQIRSMIGLVDSSVETVRRIASELRPGLLDDLGLAAAIEWQAREFQARTGIQCALEIEENLAVEGAQATALFRIFQESLTNVARHAQATSVEVQLRRSGDELTLKIADNGVGIAPEQLRRHRSLGLLGMKERAATLGATFAISGTPGEGAVVEVRLPLVPGMEVRKPCVF